MTSERLQCVSAGGGVHAHAHGWVAFLHFQQRGHRYLHARGQVAAPLVFRGDYQTEWLAARFPMKTPWRAKSMSVVCSLCSQRTGLSAPT